MAMLELNKIIYLMWSGCKRKYFYRQNIIGWEQKFYDVIDNSKVKERLMSKTIIIAEIGVNHNGCETAKRLINAAKRCGADYAIPNVLF